MRGPLLLLAAIIALLICLTLATRGDSVWRHLAAGVLLMLAAIFSLAAADTPGDSDNA